MKDNLACIELDQAQTENQDIQENLGDAIQDAIAAASLRHVDVLWLKKGGSRTHAFYKNGSYEIAICGQIAMEEIRDQDSIVAKESNCKICEKLIRRLSRMKPTSAGLKAILDIHNQAVLNEEAV